MLIQSAGMMLFRAASDEPTPRALAFFLVIVGTALLIWGGRHYAMAKGYPDWVGILSVLMCLGVLVLFLLPSRVQSAHQGSPDEQPRQRQHGLRTALTDEVFLPAFTLPVKVEVS
jgi:hypothetical protein